MAAAAAIGLCCCCILCYAYKRRQAQRAQVGGKWLEMGDAAALPGPKLAIEFKGGSSSESPGAPLARPPRSVRSGKGGANGLPAEMRKLALHDEVEAFSHKLVSMEI